VWRASDCATQRRVVFQAHYGHPEAPRFVL
jgi:hypothetical protein